MSVDEEPKRPAKDTDAAGVEDALQPHYGWLRSVVVARLGSNEGADDVMQEVHVAAIEGHVRLQKPASVAAWLYQIAVRQSQLFRRRLGRHRRRIRQATKALSYNQSESEQPLDYLMQGERRELVATALQQLPARDRELLMLKYVEGWTYRQIASHFGRTDRAVESQLQRAKQRMRDRLKGPHFADNQKRDST